MTVNTPPIGPANQYAQAVYIVDQNNNLINNSTTASLTSVVAAITSTQLLAANTARKGMYVFNDSTAILYLAFAGSASTSAYTVQIPANGFFEMPTTPVYTGAIFGIWAAANGNARITELS